MAEQGFLDEYVGSVDIDNVYVSGEAGDAAREALTAFAAAHYPMVAGY